jgi:hypothetical protein
MLPVVQRELLVASRKWHTFWTRIAAAAIAFFVVLLAIGGGASPSTGASAGKAIFSTLAWMSFWACFFGGSMLTADSLAVERREGTLGLLFLTDLRGYDVVLGKLVAKSLTGFFCLIAIVPMLAVPLLLGGVTAGEFWRTVVVLLNTLFFSLALGIFMSVFAMELRGIGALCVLAQIFILCGPLLLREFVPRFQFNNFLFSALYPPLALEAVSAKMFSAQPARFYISAALVQGICWLLLWAASARISRSWQAKPAAGLKLRWQIFRRNIVQGNAPARAALRRELLEVNPITWLHSRDKLIRDALTVFALFLAGGAFALNFHSAFSWSQFAPAIACAVFVHATLFLLVAFHAASLPIEARRDNGLELILSTELTEADILSGFVRTILRLFQPALCILAAYDLLWLIMLAVHSKPEEMGFAAASGVCLILSFAACGAAILWCAIYSAMRARRPFNAAARAFAATVLAPVAAFGLLMAGVRTDSGGLALGIFTFVALLNSWMWGSSARERARDEFREAMTRQERRPLSPDEDYMLVK